MKGVKREQKEVQQERAVTVKSKEGEREIPC